MVMQSVLTVLATFVVTLPAQRGRDVDDLRTSRCSANGAVCLFGEVGGCEITCLEPERAYCRAGYCHFGFPCPPMCRCR